MSVHFRVTVSNASFEVIYLDSLHSRLVDVNRGLPVWWRPCLKLFTRKCFCYVLPLSLVNANLPCGVSPLTLVYECLVVSMYDHVARSNMVY